MEHNIYMQRCLDLAAYGMRAAMPNPSVGAVLVHSGRIIGEGHTSTFGGPHGEVNCINSVKPQDRHLIPEATLYVSLEPCSHYGKTPPCCDLIIKQKIKRVVIGTVDPHVKVAGNGIHKLREAGREVLVGVMEKECRDSNRRFFTFHEKKRPYIILKWAQSADGFISPAERNEKKPVWISNPYSRQLVHKWRSEEMAILVGTQTVLDDNPSLDVRTWAGLHPTRIILDKTGKINSTYSVKDQKINTIVLTEQKDLLNLDNLLYKQTSFENLLPQNIAYALYEQNLLSVIIEGGARTIDSFIKLGLWDEARIFKGTPLFKNGVAAPTIKGTEIAKQRILNDELIILRNYDTSDNI
jgi:diaminohydroxyphosphoribosylaminopyrimidine deaminase/5-amino-6-(5-phosphoribosylamino)uracil reductase